MRASGSSGELRHGYQVAARTGPWVIARDEDERHFTFSARMLATDPVWLVQRPLDLVIVLGPLEWTWRNVAPTIDDDRLIVELTRRPDVARPLVV